MGVEIIVLALIFSLCAILSGYAVFGLFLLTVYRTLKLVRPEHRRMTPGLVWLCLLPYVGIIPAVWMVRAVATSLRNQFTALGEHDPVEGYLMVSGQIWTCGVILSGLLTMAGGVLDQESPTRLASNLLLMVSFGSWVVYWVRIAKFKRRLQRHFPSDYTPEELDYGDDLE